MYSPMLPLIGTSVSRQEVGSSPYPRAPESFMVNRRGEPDIQHELLSSYVQVVSTYMRPCNHDSMQGGADKDIFQCLAWNSSKAEVCHRGYS